MSDLQARRAGLRFEPSASSTPPIGKRMPSQGYVWLGVVYPAAVILIELLSRLCADAMFDPMPTVWHVLAVSFVPAMNLVVWARLDAASPDETRWLAFGGGVAAMIAACYALLFLPLLPLALVAIIIGFGFLPLAPLVSFVCSAFLLQHILRAQTTPRPRRWGLAGLAVGLVALMAVDIPMAATRLGVQWAASPDQERRDRGLALLRTAGDNDLLLRLCYGTIGRPSGPLGMLFMLADSPLFFPDRQREILVNPAAAREIYYRVHGVAFNAVPAPRPVGRQPFTDDFQFDRDLGGAEVGGRAKGLSLVQSRIDGSIAGDDAVAYLEWTLEFRNVALVEREARVELALPPGAVVSRASLWVNGEEREAAYGGRGEVRAAYQKVAVQQRRDPLLVTTKGADRVLAQAFPVPRNGGTIKFKIGITAPLDVVDRSQGRLVLPAIFDRNFSIGGDVAHDIWIESRQPLATVTGGAAVEAQVGGQVGGLYRVSGRLDDRTLTRQRQAITVALRAEAGPRLARIGDGAAVLQEIKPRTAASSVTMVVIDGSAQLAGKIGDVGKALAAIPTGAKVGVMIAAEPVVRLPVVTWDQAALARARQVLRAHRFAGGNDNAPALAEALQVLEREPGANLLWVHGPQPQVFQGSSGWLEQAVTRLTRLPAVTLYPVAAGPNTALPDMPWAWSARMLPQLGSIESDLSGFLRTATSGGGFTIERREANAEASGATKGSEHIVRLSTRDRVLEMMQGAFRLPSGAPRREETRLAAVALAAGHRLVTPISGAVVLETRQQYDENRLTPVAQGTMPTVPEPHEWALIGIAGLIMIWLMGRRRTAPARMVS